MPYAPPKQCLNAGKSRDCLGYAEVGRDYCSNCRKKTRADRRVRGGDPQSDKWRNSSRFLKARAWFLRQNPICNECKRNATTVLDHIHAHKGDYELFWNQENWQGLCEKCHRAKHPWGRSTQGAVSALRVTLSSAINVLRFFFRKIIVQGGLT